jgi:hypothetical protein
MTHQKCQQSIHLPVNKMSTQDRINQLLETQEVKDLLAEWKLSFLQLGSTGQQRLRRLLTMNVNQMTAYSDPIVKRSCNNPEYLLRENQEMDRILAGIPTFIALEGTINAATLTKYAWIHEHCTDPDVKAKVKRTLDYLIQLANRYIDDPPIMVLRR